MNAVLKLRYLTAIAVVSAAIGALLMFVMGTVTTLHAIGTYVGLGKEPAWSTDAALSATVEVVTGLDQFLLALFLIVFASGIASLWLGTNDSDDTPEWLHVRSVTDLKVQLLEVIAVILAVLFLKLLLEVTKAAELPWTLLVIPVGAGILVGAIWLIRRSEP